MQSTFVGRLARGGAANGGAAVSARPRRPSVADADGTVRSGGDGATNAGADVLAFGAASVCVGGGAALGAGVGSGSEASAVTVGGSFDHREPSVTTVSVDARADDQSLPAGRPGARRA